LSTSSAATQTRKAKAVQRGNALATEAFGSDHATQAVETLLHPIAQLMVGHSVQFGEITEILKKALVEAALKSYGGAENTLTDSRISILTGVHRKDVRRLREEPLQKIAVKQHTPLMSVAAQVVARWISEPTYLTTHNKARPLARTPRYAKPGEPDFTTLVSEVSSDVGARAVLDELQRLGIINSVDEAHVQLQDNAFIPQEGLGETFHFLASNVSDHLATAVHNLQLDRVGDVMLEQSAFSQNLSDDDAAELEQTARILWANALQQFLQKATVAEQRSSKKPNATRRVRYGVYFHIADMPLEPTSKATRAPSSKKVKP
jgi:Family of unknown function (DUF6502)